MKHRLDELYLSYNLHITDYNNLKELVKSRGKNHEENARIMREFSEDNNKLADDNNRLKDKVHQLETEQAVHKVILSQFTETTNGLRLDLKKMGDKIVAEMAAIRTSLTKTQTRDTTIIWVFKTVFYLACFAATVIGIVKYIKGIA